MARVGNCVSVFKDKEEILAVTDVTEKVAVGDFTDVEERVDVDVKVEKGGLVAFMVRGLGILACGKGVIAGVVGREGRRRSNSKSQERTPSTTRARAGDHHAVQDSRYGVRRSFD